MIVGGGEVAKQLDNYFNSDNVLGFKLMAFFAESPINFSTKNPVVFTDLSCLESFSLENDIDEIFYTMQLKHTKQLKQVTSPPQSLLAFGCSAAWGF